MRRLGLARWVLAWAFVTGTAAATPFDVPVRKAPAPEAFVPEGWSVELSVDGELNGDSETDRVLVLLQAQQENQEGEEDRKRALVVLLRTGSGWELAGTNASLLPCFQCLGVKGGEGTPEIEIKNRVIAMSVWGGSRYYYGWTYRFRWSAAVRKVQLIGLDGDAGDSVTGEGREISTNFLTGDVLTVTTPAQEDLKGNPTHALPRTKKERRAKRPLLALERVEWEH